MLSVFLKRYREEGLLDPVGMLFLIFEEPPYCFSIAAVPFYISVVGAPFAVTIQSVCSLRPLPIIVM